MDYRLKSWGLLCVQAICFALCAASQFAFQATATTAGPDSAREADAPRELAPGSSGARELDGATRHEYTIHLLAGQFLRLTVVKDDLNLAVKISDPSGQTTLELPGRTAVPLSFSFVADSSGPYRLEVRSLEDESFDGRYELHVEGPRTATTHDRKAVAAVVSLAAAEKLRAEWQGPSLRKAITEYLNAYRLLKSAALPGEAAAALDGAGEIHFILDEYTRALGFFKSALDMRQGLHDREAELQSLNNVGYVYVYTGETDKAFGYFSRTLALAAGGATHGSARAEAQANNYLGEVYYARGDLKASLGQFNKALGMWGVAGDRAGRALAQRNLGYTYADSGDLPKALDSFRQALSLYRAIGDRRGEALSETAIGTVFSFLGEKQIALDSHKRAREFFRAIGDRSGEAVTLNSIGRAFEDLNDPLTALDHYNLALRLLEENGNHGSEAVTLYYIGRLYHSQGDVERALDFYHRSIALSRSTGRGRVEAYGLLGVGAIYGSGGQGARALAQFKQVLQYYRSIGDRRGQALALNSIGYTNYLAGDKEQARANFEEALPFSLAAGDRGGEATILYHLARCERDLDRLDGALARMEESVRISESLRAKVTSQTLRTSYFASVQERYRFYIDILMQAHARQPDKGFSDAAFQISERARARSLLELLNEGRVDIRQGVDPGLLERERTLQRSLGSKAEYQMRLLSRDSGVEAAEVEGDLRRLTTEYEEVLSRIREQSPNYATLTQPPVLGLAEIQAELRGGDALLLKYTRGNEKSYLWAVSPTSVQTVELGKSARVEKMGRDLYALLSARQPVDGESLQDYQRRVEEADRQYGRLASELGETLLGKVTDRLRAKRLLVVLEGALQYIPFDALPVPSRADGAGLAPLFLDHEIVNLPSATAMVTMQRAYAGRAPARRTIAVLADPVFDQDDPRVGARGVAAVDAPPGADDVGQQSAARTRGRAVFSRLPYSLREAQTIFAVTSHGEGLMATGFDASRETVMSADLGQYRIVHFATHGIVNDKHPELSGILLSMVDRNGRKENGFLQLHDIYNLRLSADLVVLSACDTGLGEDVEGEGFVGLTRGFLYAGSQSVVASLWKVDDRATAELMGHFYKALLQDGLPPPAALRAAKEAMWRQERWKHPYYWAAFVLQGEGPEVPAGSKRRIIFGVGILLVVLGLSAAGAYVIQGWRRRRRARGVEASSPV
ncbi:MAG TPA: CHAT domain-containing protein [Pyrinomonadaceae bacterium]